MIGLILDRNLFQNHDKILRKIRPRTKENIIILFVDDPIFFNFHHSQNKRDIANTDDFVQSIQFSLCGYYDKKNNTLYMKKCPDEYVKILLETLHKYFEDSLKIVLPFSKQKLLEGFSQPQPCAWDNNLECVQRSNVFLTDDQKQNIALEVEYVKSQNESNYCSITVRLEKNSIDYLKYLTKAGVTKSKDGNLSQKEVFGKFYIDKTILQNGSIIHVLKIDKNSIVFGTEDEVKTSGSLYSFHSHPFGAYLLYNTNFGVPSAADYFAVYTMCKKNNAIMHFVSSLEGLYVISCNPEDFKFRDMDSKDVKSFIFTFLKLRHSENVSNLDEYIKKVNNLGLFKLIFIPWEKVGDQNISVTFKRYNKQCLIRD